MAMNITMKMGIFHTFKSAAVSFAHPSFSSPSSGVKYEIKFDKHKLSFAGLLFDVYCIK
jgi:hypothetical protein